MVDSMATQEEAADRTTNLTYKDIGISNETQPLFGILGKTRRPVDLEKKEKIFAILAFVSLLITIGFTIEKLATTPTDNPDFTFALVLFANACFCIYFVIHGVFFERPYELFVMVIGTAVFFVYVVANFIFTKHRGEVKIARLVISSICSPVLCLMGLIIARQYKKSARLIFRTAGADTQMQNYCKTLFSFLGILKFDLQLNVSMVILVLVTGSRVDTKDIIIVAVGLPVTVICFLCGYFCVRRESKRLAGFFVFSFLLSPAYIIYRIYKAVQDIQSSLYHALYGTTFTCAALAIIFRVLLIIFFVRTCLNFGKGVKYKVYGKNAHDDNTQEWTGNTHWRQSYLESH